MLDFFDPRFSDRKFCHRVSTILDSIYVVILSDISSSNGVAANSNPFAHEYEKFLEYLVSKR
jgi:hypothetical protein